MGAQQEFREGKETGKNGSRPNNSHQLPALPGQLPSSRPLRAWESVSGPTKPRPGELVGVEGSLIEGLLGMASGFAFGFIGTSLGHPADTVKTKLQVVDSMPVSVQVPSHAAV